MQRKGRCGRTCPGHYYPLYRDSDITLDYTIPQAGEKSSPRLTPHSLAKTLSPRSSIRPTVPALRTLRSREHVTAALMMKWRLSYGMRPEILEELQMQMHARNATRLVGGG